MHVTYTRLFSYVLGNILLFPSKQREHLIMSLTLFWIHWFEYFCSHVYITNNISRHIIFVKTLTVQSRFLHFFGKTVLLLLVVVCFFLMLNNMTNLISVWIMFWYKNIQQMWMLLTGDVSLMQDAYERSPPQKRLQMSHSNRVPK